MQHAVFGSLLALLPVVGGCSFLFPFTEGSDGGGEHAIADAALDGDAAADAASDGGDGDADGDADTCGVVPEAPDEVCIPVGEANVLGQTAKLGVTLDDDVLAATNRGLAVLKWNGSILFEREHLDLDNSSDVAAGRACSLVASVAALYAVDLDLIDHGQIGDEVVDVRGYEFFAVAADDVAIAASETQILVFEERCPTGSSEEVALYSLSQGPYEINALDAADGAIVAGTADKTLLILIRDGSDVRLVRTVDLAEGDVEGSYSNVNDLEIACGHAFVATDAGLRVVALRGVGSELVGSVDTESPLRDISVDGGLAIGAAGVLGLVVFDVANPATPRIMSFVSPVNGGIITASRLGAREAYFAESTPVQTDDDPSTVRVLSRRCLARPAE